MPCAAPLKAYQAGPKGRLSFTPINPGTTAHKVRALEIPCGQCILCRLEHARQWAVRIHHESTLHMRNSFITLTYDDAHLPEHNSLDYSHLQLFWKRLRKTCGKMRYFACGEYGDHTNRPHYHACVFGQDFLDEAIMVRETPHKLWTSPLLQRLWGMGHVSVGALTFETAQYTASYVTKKLNNARKYVRVDEETGELKPLVQPRAFMSLRPAIGLDWLRQWGRRVYDHDHVVVNGRPQKPPKYYDQWLAKEEEHRHLSIKQKRIHNAKQLTPAQTHARARIARARAESKSKSV